LDTRDTRDEAENKMKSDSENESAGNMIVYETHLDRLQVYTLQLSQAYAKY